MMRTLLLTLAVLARAAVAQAQTPVPFVWDPATCTGCTLVRYELAWGTTTGLYTAGTTTTPPDVTTAAVALPAGTFYVAVRACTATVCSGWGTEVRVVVDAPVPPTLLTVRVISSP